MGRHVLGLDRDKDVDKDKRRLFEWELGFGYDAEDIAALAALVRTTFGVLARTHSFDPEQHELYLSWTAVPTELTLAIAAATSELHVRDLTLYHWDATDWKLLRQFAESQPDLKELTLESCRTDEDTWNGLNTFPCVRVFNLPVPAELMSSFDVDFMRQAGGEDR